jgi:hypothetical protein
MKTTAKKQTTKKNVTVIPKQKPKRAEELNNSTSFLTQKDISISYIPNQDLIETLREMNNDDEPILNMRQTRFQNESSFQEINHSTEVSKIMSNGRSSAPLHDEGEEMANHDSKSHSHREDKRNRLDMSSSFGTNILKKIQNGLNQDLLMLKSLSSEKQKPTKRKKSSFDPNQRQKLNLLKQ